MKAQRVKLMRLGIPHRGIIIEQPPFIKVGQVVTDESTGLSWIVVAVEETDVIAHIPIGKPAPAGGPTT